MAPNQEPVQLLGQKADLVELPPGFRSRLKNSHLKRLRDLRNAIAADAGLPMPPIDVEPWGWHLPGAPGVIFGAARPLHRGDHHEWGALFPASTLFVIDSDALLRRLLCHEFSHCFWWIKRMLEAADAGSNGIIDSCEGTPLEVLSQIEEKDSQELANPGDWFGAEDTQAFIHEYGVPELDEPTEKFVKNWLRRGLPTRPHNPHFEVSGRMAFPAAIANRIRQLKRT